VQDVEQNLPPMKQESQNTLDSLEESKETLYVSLVCYFTPQISSLQLMHLDFPYTLSLYLNMFY